MSVPAHLEPLDAAGRDRRSAARLRLSLGSVLGPCGSSVVIHDLSLTGLLFETAADLATGETIEVLLPEMGPAMARVMWRKGPLFGCQFEHPVSRAAVSAALLRSVRPLAPQDNSPIPPAREHGIAGDSPAEDKGETPGHDDHGTHHGIRTVVIAGLMFAGLIYLVLTASLATLLIIGGVFILLFCVLLVALWVADDMPYLKL